MTVQESIARANVTAIVISQGRDVPYLRETLSALENQTHAPNRTIIGVESMEAHTAQAVAGFENADLVVVGECDSFASAIDEARAGAEGDDGEWLWLLHADSAPYPEALDRLLRTAESSRNAGAVGPKRVSWDSDEDVRTLLDVGIRATRSGRRVPEIEPGERDQGQLDSRTDVLAVGTAGMLVNRAAFDELSGLNPDFGPFGDGLELSRRLRWAGYRVIVEPSAVVRHVPASYGPHVPASFAQRRTAQIRNGLIAAPTALIPVLWIVYMLVSVPRALARLAFKEGRYARGELAAGLSVLGILPSVKRGRAEVRRVSNTNRAALSALEATPVEVRQARNDIKKSRAEAKQMETLPDPLTMRAQADLRRHTIRGVVTTLVASLAFSIALLVPYGSAGQLIGGSLAPSDATFGDVWRGVFSGWLGAGDGMHVALDPLWVATLPVLGLGLPLGLTLGHVVTAIMWLAIPLTALFAFMALGRFTLTWNVRTVLALVWASAPHSIEALLEGRLSVVLAHVLLPLFIYALVGMWRGSVMMAGLCALTLALLAATTPAYLAIAIAVAVVGFLTRTGARGRWLLLALPALTLLAPTLRHLSESDLPAYLFTSPGRPLPGTTNPTEILTFSTWAELTPEPTWDWLVYGAIAVLVLSAAFVLFRRHQHRVIRMGWWMMAAGLAWALVATRFVTGTTSGLVTESTFGLAHFGQSFAWAGLMVALGSGANALRTALRERAFGLTQLVTAGLLILVPLSIPALWAHSLYMHYTTDRDHVLIGEAAPILPAVAGEDQRADLRVLAIDSSIDGLDAKLWRGRGSELTEFSSLGNLRQRALDDDAATIDLAQGIADLTSSHNEAAQRIADHGVSVVLLPPVNEGVVDVERNELANSLQAVRGLTFVSSNEAGDFWRIEPEAGYPARARTSDGVTLDSHGMSVSGTISADVAERTLHLAERRSGYWQATLDGQPLERAGDGWAQEWVIPAGASGDVEISFSDPLHQGLALLQVIGLAFVIVAALPIRRRKVVGE